MPTLPDLIDITDVQTDLAVILPPNQDALQLMITAASRAIRQYCKRDFSQENYLDLLDGRGFSEIMVRQYPLNSVGRLSTPPTKVLSIQNTDNVTNQRATAGLIVSGDTYSGLVLTGLQLTRVASGVTTTSNLLFATYITVGALATSATALGNGWLGTPASGFANWATADFLPNTGTQAALGSGSADFQAFTSDVSAYDIDSPTGKIRLRNQTYDPVFALMNLGNTSQLSTFPLGWRNVRVEYNAGYTTIPEDIQTACLITIRDWIYQLQTSPQFQSESDVDWSSTLGDFLKRGLSDAVKQLLQPWRSFRQF